MDIQRLDHPIFRFNPWPQANWRTEDKPLLILDGVIHRLRDLQGKVSGTAAYIVGMTEKDWPAVLNVEAAYFHFYEMRVQDLSPLSSCAKLTHLKICWNTKLLDIGSLGSLARLETLILEDTPKVGDLGPLAGMPNLRAFKFAGGMNSEHKVATLEPLGEIPRLEELEIAKTRVETKGILPLAACRALRYLFLSNKFDTAEYAWLATQLPDTKCDKFAPWTRIDAINGKDILVTGKRKPLLNSQIESDRIRHFEIEFDKLCKKFVLGSPFTSDA